MQIKPREASVHLSVILARRYGVRYWTAIFGETISRTTASRREEFLFSLLLDGRQICPLPNRYG